ncbi:MAG: ArsR family transcriptional regulator [Methanoculleaceae archaeon]
MTGHVKIVNDPVDIVPLLITFRNSQYKAIYDLLNKEWLTEEEIASQYDPASVADCLVLLKKANLIEEQWRMPKPGEKPSMEFRATYSRFRANFQCSMNDLSDILYVAQSNDEELRNMVDGIEEEISSGQRSIMDLSRKYGVSPTFLKALARRVPHLDIRGQGLVLRERED